MHKACPAGVIAPTHAHAAVPTSPLAPRSVPVAALPADPERLKRRHARPRRVDALAPREQRDQDLGLQAAIVRARSMARRISSRLVTAATRSLFDSQAERIDAAERWATVVPISLGGTAHKLNLSATNSLHARAAVWW